MDAISRFADLSDGESGMLCTISLIYFILFFVLNTGS